MERSLERRRRRALRGKIIEERWRDRRECEDAL